MNLRHIRLAAMIVLSAAAMTTVSATPATAATTPIVGGGSFARTIPFIDGWVYAFECHAAAPGAVSTTVSQCNLMSVYPAGTASAVTSQGPVATTDGAVSTSPAAQYRVCWTVSARHSDGSTQSMSGCSFPASSIAGAG
jgi:hypothetical protein